MSGVSTLGQALEQIERIKNQQLKFGMLSTQLTSGKKTQVYSGLGTGVLTSERARTDFKSVDTYINNIKNADRRIKLMLTAIEEFQKQAENFSAALTNFSQESIHQEGEVVYWDDPVTANVIENVPVGASTGDPDADFRNIQNIAGNMFEFMVSLLNMQENDRYILGGAETLTKPLDITGTLDSAITSLLTDWKDGTITTDNLIADLQDRTTTGGNLDALTDTVIGYNSVLSNGDAGKVFIRVSDTAEIEYSVIANHDAFRDIIVALSYIKSETLPPMADEVQIDPNTGLPVIITEGAPGDTTHDMKENFFAVFNRLTTMVSVAIDDIDQLRFKLEGARARMSEIKTDYANQKNLLLSTISDVEDIDANEVALSIKTLEIQLEASYRVTALTANLSLVNFLPL